MILEYVAQVTKLFPFLGAIWVAFNKQPHESCSPMEFFSNRNLHAIGFTSYKDVPESRLFLKTRILSKALRIEKEAIQVSTFLHLLFDLVPRKWI